MLRIFLALASAAASWGQVGAPGGPVAEERAAGFYALGGRGFRVILNVHRLGGEDSGEAVASVEVRDEGGATHFERKLPHEINGARFQESTGVEAALVQGRKGSGLLLAYSVKPSTPLGGNSWQLLGVVGEKLQAFSKPVALEGQLVEQLSGKPVGAAWDSALEADVLNFRVWTGRFFVIVPLAVDWEWGGFRPAYFLPRCRWRVEADRRPGQGRAFVKLYPEPGAKAGEPRTVAVTPASKVDFLTAEGGLTWEESEDQIWLGVSENIWLQVRIDGEEGWLQAPEDLDAAGLPEAG